MLPAARIADMHACPMVTPGVPPVPHVGGPISMGLPTVLIGMMPAARLNDMAICVGPPDTIAMGSPTVQSGNMMNARLSDPTVHGGLVTAGLPTVLIGPAASCFPGSVAPMPAANMTFTMRPDGTAVGTFGPNITVTGTPQFVSQTLGNLAALAALKSGRAIINSLSRPVGITQTGAGGDGAGPAGTGWNNPNLYNGTGTNAAVSHHPNQQVVYGGTEPWQTMPPHVVLGHELTHASHITNGNLAGDPTSGPATPGEAPSTGLPLNRAREERRTVGLPASPANNVPDYTGEPFSENTVRADQGLPARPRYTRSQW